MAALISKVKIKGYRIYRDFELVANRGFNLLVGANDSGKSTLMEAVGLGLTGRVNGRWASEELNPYWFNVDVVAEFVSRRKAGARVAFPDIRIELFFENSDELQQLCGANNTDLPTRACPGVTLRIAPDTEYAEELETWAQEPSPLLPVEYYKVDWRSFADAVLTQRPRQLATAFIDSRTVRSSSGVDYHMRQILGDHLEPGERAKISLSFRRAKAAMSTNGLQEVNQRIAALKPSLHGRQISLAMDQSARTSWEGSVTPHVESLPFSMAGHGEQAAVKIALAMDRHSERSNFVMIEEPENHLTHTSLATLLARIEDLAEEHQQLFVTTHSSFVLNRLGIDKLHLLNGGNTTKLSLLNPETVAYFQKLPGYDTLRMVLADKVVLVEGPSDEIVFERFFRDIHGKRPMDCGIDVLSMRGLSLGRCLELCAALDKTAVALRDNDGTDPQQLLSPLGGWLSAHRRQVFIGDLEYGHTLEPQLIRHNREELLRQVLGISAQADLLTWMTREKTEAALRIAQAPQTLVPPKYMQKAAEFIRG